MWILWRFWKVFRIVRCRKSFFNTFSHFWKFRHKIHPFCTLHQTPLKQSSNGAILGQNRSNCTFGSKITFWAQKCFWGPECTFGAKSDFGWKVRFGAKSPPWNSHELTYPQPKSHPGLAGRQKVIFAPKHFLAQNAFGAQKCIVAPKFTFWGKMHFCVPMPRMLIKPM